jgi:hypothetical protein
LVNNKISQLKIMIKYVFTLMVVCLYIACQQPAKQNKATTMPASAKADTSITKGLSPDRMITPGGGIGKITIGENADSTIAALGKPDGGDAAMGAQTLTWYTNHDSTGYQINVYAHRNMGAADEAISRVRVIRVTSPAFNTSERVHTGMPFGEIKKHFRVNMRPVSKTADKYAIYEDTRAGIAFEVDHQNNCSAILVFAWGGTSGSYLSIR